MSQLSADGPFVERYMDVIAYSMEQFALKRAGYRFTEGLIQPDPSDPGKILTQIIENVRYGDEENRSSRIETLPATTDTSSEGPLAEELKQHDLQLRGMQVAAMVVAPNGAAIMVGTIGDRLEFQVRGENPGFTSPSAVDPEQPENVELLDSCLFNAGQMFDRAAKLPDGTFYQGVCTQGAFMAVMGAQLRKGGLQAVPPQDVARFGINNPGVTAPRDHAFRPGRDGSRPVFVKVAEPS